MVRPSVNVVVPFRGDPAGLARLRERLTRLRLAPGDSILVVDNTPGGRPDDGPVPVLSAPELPTPGFARNHGAAAGDGDWLVFIDADIDPDPDLLTQYFDPPPGERTGLLAGGVRDEAIPPGGPAAARYAFIRELMSQDDTLRYGDWSFPKTANAACRREAFEAVGGFREDIRASEDADLAYRLRAAGWEVERRDGARSVHLNRQTLSGFVAQKAIHGGGLGWLTREYPGVFPPRRRAELLGWGARTFARHLAAAVRERDRDQLLWAVFEPLEYMLVEFARVLPNERPLPPGSFWRRVPPLRGELHP